MRLEFAKMHGLGNDFVIVNGLDQPIQLTRDQLLRIADRRFGIGCDQVLLLERAQKAGITANYRIFNADGSEVGQCGNGSRCVAAFLETHGYGGEFPLRLRTSTTEVVIYRHTEGYRVNMGVPEFDPANIPIKLQPEGSKYRYALTGGDVTFTAMSLGNPHAVISVDDVSDAAVEYIGSRLQDQDIFPDGVNVGFMAVAGRKEIDLRVFERGVGETIACGSGACAAVVAGHQTHGLDDLVTVRFTGGALLVEWTGDGAPVWMTGPAETVFEGEIEI